MNRMRVLVGLWIILTCLAQSPAPAQFKTSVRLVNIAFTVRDARGALVNDLARDDIEVLDDGAAQSISFFARASDLALSLGLVVDASGSQQPFVRRHQSDVKEFLKRVLTKQDQAFVLCFGNHLRLASDLSSSSAELAESLDTCRGGTAPEVGGKEIRILGTAFYDAIHYSATERLAGAANGRKALIVFSDGEDNSSAHHLLDAIEGAQAENVVVYGVRYTEVKHGVWNARNKYGKSVMERISRDTGGRDFDAGGADLKSAFRAIDEELRSSYEVAYKGPAADGTFHKVTVRVKREGVTVRAKTGYFARE